MERRKTPRHDWVVGRDEVGRTVLEWKVDHRFTERLNNDPLAKTYDFLERLEVPGLALEEDVQAEIGINPYDTGVNPYDTGIHRLKREN
ncbi:MAG TPA: hypothetical protein VF322_11945 [Gammaproteobacteria bacterium]